MAGFALIFARDGSPVDPERLARMARHLQYRGSGIATWIDGPVGLAQIGDRHGGNAGVAAAADGAWRVVFDGRLDNREELVAELLAGTPGAGIPGDAAIAALACERWGRGAAGRLRGDFAVAAWHARPRQLLLIRDIRGLKPLYVRLDHREVSCASDLRTLVLDRAAAPNEGMIAEWLTGAPASHRETVYAGIRRLPMAHAATIAASSASECQYWTPVIDPDLAAAADAERAGRFATLLADAVGARSASASRVAIMLSGGLDSSSVAATLAASGRREIGCFTLAAEHDRDDESGYARAVARHLGCGHTIVPAAPVSAAAADDDVAFTLDIPATPNGLQSLALRRAVAGHGYAVALSGLGSDEWFSGSFLLYADLARRGAFLELARTVWADRHREEPTRARLQIAAWALCPPWVKDPVRRVLARRTTGCVSAALARRVCLSDRLRASDIAPPPLASLSQRALYTETSCGAYAAAIEMQERGNAMAGLDERYPFHDRRLIEFSLGLPESDRWAAGHYKGVIRRAMADRLPAAVVARQTSPNANPVLAATLRSAGRAFFERLQIADAGWVDRRRVLDTWQTFERREHGGAEAWGLWAVAAVELWWRHATAGAGVATRGDRSSVA